MYRPVDHMPNIVVGQSGKRSPLDREMQDCLMAEIDKSDGDQVWLAQSYFGRSPVVYDFWTKRLAGNSKIPPPQILTMVG